MLTAAICIAVALFLGGVAYRLRESALAFFLCAGAALQYSYSIGAALAPGEFIGNFWTARPWINFALIVVIIFFATQLLCSILARRRGGEGIAQIDRPYVVGAFFVLSLVGLILFLAVSGLDFHDRLQSRAGSGFLFIFGYAGLALCLAIAAGAVANISLIRAIILCLPTAAFFAAAGHRSTTLIALACPLIMRFGSVVSRRRIMLLAIFCGGVLSANYVNYLTGSIRSLLEQKREISVETIAQRYETLRGVRPIPLASSHLEMLAGYLEQADGYDLALGTFETAGASLFNFLPRAFFPDKDLTSGVYFASMYFPEWFAYGYHTSSLTTGLYLDLVFNFGLMLGFALLIVLYIASGLVIGRLLRAGGAKPILGIYLAWVLGFDVFFDDLGGVVNKLVIGIIFYLCARSLIVVAQITKGRVS